MGNPAGGNAVARGTGVRTPLVEWHARVRSVGAAAHMRPSPLRPLKHRLASAMWCNVSYGPASKAGAKILVLDDSKIMCTTDAHPSSR